MCITSRIIQDKISTENCGKKTPAFKHLLVVLHSQQRQWVVFCTSNIFRIISEEMNIENRKNRKKSLSSLKATKTVWFIQNV